MKATITHGSYFTVAPAKAGVQPQLQSLHLFFEKFITANNNQTKPNQILKNFFIYPQTKTWIPAFRLRQGYDGQVAGTTQATHKAISRRPCGYGRQAPGTAKENAVGVITVHCNNRLGNPAVAFSYGGQDLGRYS